MAGKRVSQNYPRLESGLLDIKSVVDHKRKIELKDFRKIILDSVEYAQGKSSRMILEITAQATESEIDKKYLTSGKELFDYFRKYCGDPAGTAKKCYRKHYEVIAREMFHNRSLQKERMNSGWRYQYIAKETAEKTERFRSISDLGAQEADFTAKVEFKTDQNHKDKYLNIYTSVKNRTNTMGGQDWPKAIFALEETAIQDKNRQGVYICVFGIAMEKGQRNIKGVGKTKSPHSYNTEVWKSEFFWPFFTNFEYDEVIKEVLTVLLEHEKEEQEFEIPRKLLDSFYEQCMRQSLLDENGCFNDPFKLANFFCGSKGK